MVEGVESVQAIATAHSSLPGEQLIRREAENGLAAWATGQHRKRTLTSEYKTPDDKSSPTQRADSEHSIL
jgi:hypothetical protein